MYVEDIDDLDELHDLYHRVRTWLYLSSNSAYTEQAQWDLVDIRERIDEIEQGREL